MLFVMVLFVAVVVDVGQAVNRRIGLQIVADAGAFTGATNMAVGLNNIAYWNKWIQTFWTGLSYFTGGFFISPFPCEANDAAVNVYKGLRAGLGVAIATVNMAYMVRPAMEARRVSEYNIADLFPGELEKGNFTFAEWNLSPEVGVILPKRNLFPFTTAGQASDQEYGVYKLRQVGDGTSPEGDLPAFDFGFASSDSRRSATWGCPCEGIPFLTCAPFTSADFNVWYEKENSNVNYFVWLVTARPIQALMFDSILGPNAIPEMRAVGVAKPVGGTIVDGTSEYVAKMVPASKVMLSPFGTGVIYDSQYKSSFRVVTH